MHNTEILDPEIAALAAMPIADIAAATGIPLEKWTGQCYGVALALLNSGLVPTGTRAVYGHWRGPISPQSAFASRRELGLTGHGWLITADDQIIDPTRFAFEAADPYIYIGTTGDDDIAEQCRTCGHLVDEHEAGFLTRCAGGDNAGYDCGLCIFEPNLSEQSRLERDHYDEGGNQLALQNLRPFPAHDPGDIVTRADVPTEASFILATHGHRGGALTAAQAHWVANVPLTLLGPAARELYLWLADNGLMGLVPIDNWMRATGNLPTAA